MGKIVSELARGIVAVPKTNVFVRQLSVKDRSELLAVHQRLEKESKQGEASAWVVLFAAVDQDGNRLFTPDQIAEVLDSAAEVVDHIAEHALKLNGLNKDAKEEEKKSSG